MVINNNYKVDKTINDCREHCVCGYVVYMSPKEQKRMCKWCGRTIVNKSKARFKYVLLQQGVIEKEIKC